MIRKNNAFAIIFSLVLVSCYSRAQEQDLTVIQFREATEKQDVQILDVRTKGEYNTGHLKGAFLADWTQQQVFEERIKSLDKTKAVYTYCLSGGRSRAAADKLRQNGFAEVYNMEGGILAWKKAQLPLQVKTPVKAMTYEAYLNSIPANETILVDIGAEWCPPCKKMESVISELLGETNVDFRLLRIDGGEQEALASALNATAFPTFIIYKNGKETWRQSGIVAKETLLQQLR